MISFRVMAHIGIYFDVAPRCLKSEKQLVRTIELNSRVTATYPTLHLCRQVKDESTYQKTTKGILWPKDIQEA